MTLFMNVLMSKEIWKLETIIPLRCISSFYSLLCLGWLTFILNTGKIFLILEMRSFWQVGSVTKFLNGMRSSNFVRHTLLLRGMSIKYPCLLWNQNRWKCLLEQENIVCMRASFFYIHVQVIRCRTLLPALNKFLNWVFSKKSGLVAQPFLSAACDSLDL